MTWSARMLHQRRWTSSTDLIRAFARNWVQRTAGTWQVRCWFYYFSRAVNFTSGFRPVFFSHGFSREDRSPTIPDNKSGNTVQACHSYCTVWCCCIWCGCCLVCEHVIWVSAISLKIGLVQAVVEHAVGMFIYMTRLLNCGLHEVYEATISSVTATLAFSQKATSKWSQYHIILYPNLIPLCWNIFPCFHSELDVRCAGVIAH